MFSKRFFLNLLLGLTFIAWIAAVFAASSRTLTFWPAGLLLACVVAMSAFTLGRGFHGRANLICVALTLAFCSWIVLRGAISDVKWLARQDVVFCIGGFLAYLSVAAVFETVPQRRWILGAWLFLLAANLGAAVWQSVSGNTLRPHGAIASWFPKLGGWLGWTGMARSPIDQEVAGFFQSENHFAGLAEMLGIFSLGWALLGNSGKAVRLLCWVLFFGSIGGIILSTSRGAYVAFFGGTAVLVFLWWLTARKAGTSSRRSLAIGGAVLVAFIACAAVGGIYALKRQYTRGGVLSSDHLTGRKVLTKLGWEVFNSQPFTGAGARAYEYEERSRRSLATDEWAWFGEVDADAEFAHNDWIQLLADYGLVGGLLGVAMVLGHGWSGFSFLWRRAKQRHEQGIKGGDDRLAWTVGALGAISAMALHSIIDFNMHLAVNALIAAGLLALLANPGRESLVVPEVGGEALIPRHGVLLRPVLFVAALAGAGYLLLYGPDWFRADVAERLGERLRDEGKYFEAAEALQKVIDHDDQNYSAYMIWAHLNEDQTADIDSLPPPVSQAQATLRMQVRDSHLRSALGQYEKAYRLYPQNPYTAMGVANCSSQLRDFEGAEKWFSSAFAYGKASRRLMMHYGEHLIRKGAASSDARTRLDFYVRAKDAFRKAEERMGLQCDTREYLKERQADLARVIEELGKLIANPPQPAPPNPGPAAPSNPNP